jgi:hypothetical protein
MKMDFSTFHASDFRYDYSLCGTITVDDDGFQREIEVEIRPDINGNIFESSKEELQFFADNYDKYREIYLDALLSYYQELRTGLGYYCEEEVDGYPYITTIEQLLETIKFTGIIIHEEKRNGHHAIGLYFDTTWEEEHGAGVLMAGYDVIDTGNFDHAYYAYALSD